MLFLFKKTVSVICINGFAQKFFNLMLEKRGFWQSYLPLKCSLSMHFNKIITRFKLVIWNIFFSLILMVPIVKSNFQNGGGVPAMFHPLPDSYRDRHLKLGTGSCWSCLMWLPTQYCWTKPCTANILYCHLPFGKSMIKQ